ncbi:hypothetical protein ACH492_13080 [Streptomyces sp. NPDC019443]|uniref:hypothetical protein n=1 Tax=Streptomyces sp. NPDC019443 TaxID=3365061 RepID=UPI0037BA443F
MVRSVLAHHLHQRFNDAEIGQLVRHGRTAASSKDREAVPRGTEQVFSDLYDATVGGGPPAGSLQVHLLTTARTPALREWNRAPEAWGRTLDTEGAARPLTDGSLLRFDTIDFGDDARTRTDVALGLMAHGPPGAEIAVRLDRPDAPVVATIPIPQASSARWVHAPMRPTAGVHAVNLTACYAAGNACVSIT